MNRTNNQRGGIKLRALVAVCAVIVAISAWAYSFSPLASSKYSDPMATQQLDDADPVNNELINFSDVVVVKPGAKS